MCTSRSFFSYPVTWILLTNHPHHGSRNILEHSTPRATMCSREHVHLVLGWIHERIGRKAGLNTFLAAKLVSTSYPATHKPQFLRMHTKLQSFDSLKAVMYIHVHGHVCCNFKDEEKYTCKNSYMKL